MAVEKEKEGEQTTGEQNEMMSLLKGISAGIDSLTKRVTKLEKGDKLDFKEGAKAEDIANAKRVNVDPKAVEIVNELLGTDFGVVMESYDDKPGFLFTVIVPQRLSDNVKGNRPVIDEKTGKYKMKNGEVVTEEYYAEDRRSRAISSGQSYDVIRQHCEKVRAYIVAYHAKMNKPLPAFNVK